MRHQHFFFSKNLFQNLLTKGTCFDTMNKCKSGLAKTSISLPHFSESRRTVQGGKCDRGNSFRELWAEPPWDRRLNRRRPLSAEVLLGTRRGSCRKASAKQSGITVFAVPAPSPCGSEGGFFIVKKFIKIKGSYYERKIRSFAP